MAEVQTKSDVQGIGNNIQHTLERIGLPLLIKFFKRTFSTVYHQHIEGIKAIQRDGPTPEVESFSDLSYEEVVMTLTKCQKDNVKAIVTEFKKGNEEVDREFGKDKSLSKMQQITKAQRMIDKYKVFQKKHPNIAEKEIAKRIEKWQDIKEKAINKHEGYRYTILFNKSKMGYFGERMVDIKNSRLSVKDAISKDNPEVQKVLELMKEKGLDFNSDKIRSFAGEFINKGNVDISQFNENYIIHTIDLKDYGEIYDKLKSTGIDYAVDNLKIFNASHNASAVPAKEDVKVKIYIKNSDLKEYQKLNVLGNGVVQSIGKIKDDTIEEDLSPNSAINNRVEIEFPKEETYQWMDKFRGKEYSLYAKDKDTMVVSIDKNNIEEVHAYEKKRDVVQEKVDELDKQKDLNKDKEVVSVEQTRDASPGTTIVEASDTVEEEPEIEIEVDGDE